MPVGFSIEHVKAIVVAKFPNAYATYGIQMFTNRKIWRVEDGNGTTLAGRQSTEYEAWEKASHKTPNNI